MGRAFSLLGIVIVTAIGGYILTNQARETTPAGAVPRTAASVIGVRNDLLSIANGELRYRATHAKYATLDVLSIDGDIPVPTRPDFKYSAEANDNGFTITAIYSGSDPRAPKRISIDQTMALIME